MGTYAEASDVIGRWVGPNAPADTSQIETFIGDAETLIAREFPTLADDVDGDGKPTSDEVRMAVCTMVIRHLLNPERIQSRSIGGPDGFGGSVTYAGSNPGALVITDEERRILSGPQVVNTGPFAIDTAPCLGDGHALLCALRFGANYCSCGYDIAGFPLYEDVP